MECGISHPTELVLQALSLHIWLKGTSRAQFLLLHSQNSTLELFSAAYTGSALGSVKTVVRKASASHIVSG